MDSNSENSESTEYKGQTDSNDESAIIEKQGWYNGDSDTDDTIPDPTLSPEALYQDVGNLPVPVQKKHFEESSASEVPDHFACGCLL